MIRSGDTASLFIRRCWIAMVNEYLKVTLADHCSASHLRPAQLPRTEPCVDCVLAETPELTGRIFD